MKAATYDIHISLDDRWGNPYHDKSKVYITISKSVSSSGNLTLDHTKKVFLQKLD